MHSFLEELVADQDKLRARLELFRNGGFVFQVDWGAKPPWTLKPTSSLCFGFALGSRAIGWIAWSITGSHSCLHCEWAMAIETSVRMEMGASIVLGKKHESRERYIVYLSVQLVPTYRPYHNHWDCSGLEIALGTYFLPTSTVLHIGTGIPAC